MTDYREIDGSNNNINTGGTHDQLIRKTPQDYGDGSSAPAGQDRPSGREISNELFDQEGDLPNVQGASNFMWVWGQFIDHDITLTKEGDEYFPIEVPAGDQYFDPFNTGTKTIPFNRSGYDESVPDDQPRQQVNEITPFIDASMVYGSDKVTADSLRGNDGKMKLYDDQYLPVDENSGMFQAGDVRAAENSALISMHTLFVREHNRLVDELKVKNPTWDDETLYQEAKIIVEAEIQHITYDEYLPMLLGEGALPEYTGFKADVNPQMANIFSTAAFRLGHTMLSGTLHRVDESGAESEYGHLALRDAFFNPDKVLKEGGVDPIIRGVATESAQAVDLKIIDDVRNFLFGPPGSGGLDLGALNVQRGRDHGLSDYNSAREAYGLPKVTSFAQITSDVSIQEKLEELFGTVDNIDVFVGGLAEDPVDGSMLGSLFHTVVVDQFVRIRDGDKYWYEDRLSSEQLEYVKGLQLSDIIELNTDIEHMQDNVFLTYNRIGGDDGHNEISGTHERDLIIGGDGHDELKGSKGDDQLHGDSGHDDLRGGKGDDKLEGGIGHDILKGGKGDDTLDGGDGHDELHGGKGDDVLISGAGFDELHGGKGNDVLIGDKGGNVLYGGQGSDTHVFTVDESQNGIGLLYDVDNTIGDLKLNQGDKLLFKTSGNWTIEQLNNSATFTSEGNDLLIEFDGGGSIRVNGHGDAKSLEDLNTELVHGV